MTTLDCDRVAVGYGLVPNTGLAEVLLQRDPTGRVTAAGTLRTARKLFDGRVFP